MAASGGSILGELKARMDALTEETTNAPRPFATIAALEDRVAELSAFHDDTSPPSKPKARAFEEGPPKVDSPPDIVDLASAPPSIGSVSGSEEDEEDEEDASEAEQDLSDAEATEPKQKPDGSDPVPSGSGSSISGTSKKTVTVESKGKNKGGKATSSPPKATANSEATRAKEQDAQRMRDLSYTNQQPNNCTSLKDAVFFCSNTSSEAKVKFCLISMKRHVEKKYTEDSTGGTPEEQALTTTLKKELSKVQDQLNSKEKFLTRKLKELCELTAANRSGGDHVQRLQRELGVTRDLLSQEKRKFEAFATLQRQEKLTEINEVHSKAREHHQKEVHRARLTDAKAIAEAGAENQKLTHMLSKMIETCEHIKARAAAHTHPLNHAPSHRANQHGRARPSATSGRKPTRPDLRMCPTLISGDINISKGSIPLEKRTVAVEVSECQCKGTLSSKKNYAGQWPQLRTACNRQKSNLQPNFGGGKSPKHKEAVMCQVAIPGETGQIFAYSYRHEPSPNSGLDTTYTWATPITELQRLYHAAHGNGYRTNNKKCNSPGCELRMYHRFGHTFEIMKPKASGPNTRGHSKAKYQSDLHAIFHDTAVTEQTRGAQRTHQGGTDPCRSPHNYCDTNYSKSLGDTMLEMHGRWLYKDTDVIEAMLQLPCSYTWALPMTERQRLHHALHGNGTRLITKIMTDGIPMLEKGANSAEEFIEFELDLRGWCSISGCLNYVIGPAPAVPAGAPRSLQNTMKSSRSGYGTCVPRSTTQI